MDTPPNDFYTTKDHVVTFLNKFGYLYPDKQNLTLVEKFTLYTEEYSDYDCWCAAIYIAFNPKSTDLTDKNYVRDSSGIYVSLGGRVVNSKGETLSISGNDLDRTELYPRICMNGHMVPLHRLFACTFIKRFDLSSIPFHRLVVNHKNGDKKDYSSNNLEWTTPKGNTEHAVSAGLRKSGIYKMILNRDVRGYPAGSEFFFRKRDLIKHGIAPSSPCQFIAGIINESYSSSWELYEDDGDLKLGLPADLKASDLLPPVRKFVFHHPEGNRLITWEDLKLFNLKHDRVDRAIEKSWKVLNFYWSLATEKDDGLPKGFPSSMKYSEKRKFIYLGISTVGEEFRFKDGSELTIAGYNPAVVRAGIRENKNYYGLTWSREYI